jgi:hypothetical protein
MSSFSHDDNPQIKGIDVAPFNVEVLSIEPHEQEGKTIYSLQLQRSQL